MRRRPDRPLALAAAVALTLGSGVWASFTVGRGQVAPETVTTAVGAQVTQGTTRHVARAGERLRAGDVLTTSATGSATVLSPGRRLLLGPHTEVTVGSTSGPSYDVRAGSVGLDVESGRPVVLLADAVTATTLTRPARVRMDRSSGTVRVASLAGGTNVTVTGGAQLALGQYDETSALGATLPGASVPVSVIDPSPRGLDAALEPALAQAEGALERLAHQVDADPAAPALFDVSGTAGERASEIALPRAIGMAGTVRASLDDRIRRARVLRASDGAFAVVAAELAAPVPAVTAALSDLLTPAGQAASGDPGPSPVTPSSPAGSAGTTGTPAPVPSTGPRPSRGAPSTSATPGGGGSPTSAPPSPTGASPTPAPTTAPGVVGGLLGTVTTLLGPVLRPSPTPTG